MRSAASNSSAGLRSFALLTNDPAPALTINPVAVGGAPLSPLRVHRRTHLDERWHRAPNVRGASCRASSARRHSRSAAAREDRRTHEGRRHEDHVHHHIDSRRCSGPDRWHIQTRVPSTPSAARFARRGWWGAGDGVGPQMGGVTRQRPTIDSSEKEIRDAVALRATGKP